MVTGSQVGVNLGGKIKDIVSFVGQIRAEGRG